MVFFNVGKSYKWYDRPLYVYQEDQQHKIFMGNINMQKQVTHSLGYEENYGRVHRGGIFFSSGQELTHFLLGEEREEFWIWIGECLIVLSLILSNLCIFLSSIYQPFESYFSCQIAQNTYDDIKEDKQERKFSLNTFALGEFTFLSEFVNYQQAMKQVKLLSNYQLQNIFIMQALEKYSPYKAAGDDFADSNPIFSYYFYKFYLDIAENILVGVDLQSERAEIEAQIKIVNIEMGKMQNKSVIKVSDEKNLTDILEYTELMFAKNQHQLSQNFKSKQMAEDFLTIHRLYEVVKHFNGLDAQQDKRRIFAKKRFIDIMKELKNQPEKKPEQQPPTPKPLQQKIKQSVFKAPLPKPSNVISYDKIQMQIQANKRLQNAVSQLSFDRYKFAKEEVIAALQILQQLCQ